MSHGGAPSAAELPGIALAALTSLALGAVLGPEAPLIALGGGLAVYAVRLVRPGIEPSAAAMVGGGGELRRRQHPAGLPAARRVPADGGVRARRDDARPGARPGAAGLRHRLAHLHRAGLVDRAGDVLPDPARCAARRRAHPGRVRLGRRAGRRGGLRRDGDQAAGPAAAGTHRTADGVVRRRDGPGRRACSPCCTRRAPATRRPRCSTRARTRSARCSPRTRDCRPPPS